MQGASEDGVHVSPATSVLSGFIAGLLVVLIGVAASQLGEPFPGRSPFEPSVASVAAALAAAVAAYRSGASIGTAIALALGAAIFTYFVGIWVTHWMGVGGMVRRRPVSPVALGWRRDLAVSLCGIAVGSFLGMFLGKR